MVNYKYFMLKVNRSFTRKNADVQFSRPKLSEKFQTNIQKKYIDTGKLIKQESILSDDKLTVQLIMWWRSHDDYFDFVTDDECHDIGYQPTVNNDNIIYTLNLELTHD